MLVTGFPAGTFQTNCWLVAASAGSEALVVDPGQDALAGVEELCRRHRLKPVAAVLTHGHLDHVWTVAPLAGVHDIPAFVHPADRHLLTDPLAGFGPEAQAAFAGLTLQEPDDVRELADGQVVELAGVRLVVDHTPGHTPGHVTFRSEAEATSRAPAGRGPGVRRLDRPHRPARRVDRGDAGLAGLPVPAPAGRDGGAARPRPDHHRRPGAGHQPVPGRAGAGWGSRA